MKKQNLPKEVKELCALLYSPSQHQFDICKIPIMIAHNMLAMSGSIDGDWICVHIGKSREECYLASEELIQALTALRRS